MKLLRRLDWRRFKLPRGWGIAWNEPDLAVVVIAPFGLHLLIGWTRRAYWWVATRGTGYDVLEKAYLNGYEAGVQSRARQARLEVSSALQEGEAKAINQIARVFEKAFKP